jgi:hypothetical protein
MGKRLAKKSRVCAGCFAGFLERCGSDAGRSQCKRMVGSEMPCFEQVPRIRRSIRNHWISRALATGVMKENAKPSLSRVDWNRLIVLPLLEVLYQD